MNQNFRNIDLSDTKEYLTIGLEDLNLYFADTYLYFPKKEEWGYLKEFRSDNLGKIYFEVRGLPDFVKLENEKIDFCFPEIGLYNYKNGVVFFFRRNQRQNKKGLCETTGLVLNAINLFKEVILISDNFKMSQMFRWSPKSVNQLFIKGKLLSLEEAFIGILKLKHFARAITREFFLAQGIDSKFPSLWFRQSLIGFVMSKESIIIKNKAFIQEALDYFIPLGISVDTTFDLGNANYANNA